MRKRKFLRDDLEGKEGRVNESRRVQLQEEAEGVVWICSL